jgi:anti-sigma regulatory factor (Ser/Thr protein kinase)
MRSRASAESAQADHYSDPQELSDPGFFALDPQFTPAPTTPRDPQARDHSWLSRWPLRSYLELGALDTAPGSARAHVGAVLREWGLGDIADDACLIVSEVVTNAVTATRDADSTEPVRIWVLADTRTGVLFLVWDATMPAPVFRVTTPDAEHGRGLAIVDAVSARWGSYPAGGQAGGKVVWAQCALEAPDCIPGSAGRNSEDIPGSMAYLASKDKGDRSMPLKRWSFPGIRGGVPQDPRNMVKAKLPEPQSPVD